MMSSQDLNLRPASRKCDALPVAPLRHLATRVAISNFYFQKLFLLLMIGNMHNIVYFVTFSYLFVKRALLGCI